jgi:TonB family protein
VFQTERQKDGVPQKAAIKLVVIERSLIEERLSRWAATAKLSHPNLVRLFENGRCYLAGMEMAYVVMEYADENLGQILPKRPLTAQETRDMVKPALDALAYIHSKGFVHGHVRPANIMAVDDQLKLSTDGLYRMGEPHQTSVKLGVYDPPESAHGRMAPACDVWSMGVLVVEALTQRVPVWERKEQAEPELPGRVPQPFLELVRRCMRRDPQLRWTVADLAARLEKTMPSPERQAASKPLLDRLQLPKVRLEKLQDKHIAWAAAASVALGFMLLVPKLVRHRSIQPVRSVAAAEPTTSAKPQRRSVAATTKEPSQRSSERLEVISASAPAPVALRSRKSPAHTSALVHGEVRQQVLPQVPQSASNTIHGTVRVNVRVAVDPSGNVSLATFDQSGPSRYFARKALQAAQAWKFEPPKLEGRNIASEWILRFEFKNTGPRVFPLQATP